MSSAESGRLKEERKKWSLPVKTFRCRESQSDQSVFWFWVFTLHRALWHKIPSVVINSNPEISSFVFVSHISYDDEKIQH